MKQLNGIKKVFCFTFAQRVKTKGYRLATILLAVLCLAAPAVIMTLVELLGGAQEEAISAGAVKTVYVADMTGDESVSYELLNQMGADGFTDIAYIDCPDAEDAIRQANEDPASLVLIAKHTDVQTLSEADMGSGSSGQIGSPSVELSVLLPDNSDLTEQDAAGYENFLKNGYYLILVGKSGLSVSQLLSLSVPVNTQVQSSDETPKDATEIVRMVLEMLLPYLCIMVLYFLVLIYGQGVANNIIIEKTSKLMDTFLVSVRPGAMILGKVFALVLADILQFIIWIVSLIGGFVLGAFMVRAVNPGSQMGLLLFFDNLNMFSGVFSMQGIITAVMLMFAGLLLYCALAAVGGAIAGKPEDLSTTNVLFTMILVISFMCALFMGGIPGMEMEGAGAAPWLDWFPFTSILITPGRIMLGTVTIWQGLGSLAIVLVCSVLILALAGRLYKMMALFKGDLPGIGKLLGMLKQKT